MEQNFYRDPATGKDFPEKRSGVDRRVPTSFWATCAGPFRRRRSRGRRKTDQGAYVDIYDSRSWLIAIAVICLSAVDAFMTALHLSAGTARELNPIMDAIIQHGGFPAFFAAKAAMTLIPLAIIFVHKEWTLGRYAARLCLWAYILLCSYHIYLVMLLEKA